MIIFNSQPVPFSERRHQILLQTPTILLLRVILEENITMPDGSLADVDVASSSTPAHMLDRDSNGHQKKTLTRVQVAKRIAAGETLVLHRRRVYKLDSWLARHPGGELAILHFVGRDATDELEAYHCDETLRKMRAFTIGMLDEQDWQGKEGQGYKPLVPPVQLGYRSGKLDHPDAQWTMWEKEVERTKSQLPKDDVDESVEARLTTRPEGFPLPVSMLEPPSDPAGIEASREQAISKDYRDMHDQVKAAGLYTLQPWGYARECARYVTLAAISAGLWYHSYHLLSAIFLGLFWHQLTFTAHDAGHTGITHNHFADRLIGTIIADYLGGLSIGWWCDNHDVHHLVTNHPEHDPDIQHMPFFAISPQFLVQTSPSGNSAEPSFGIWSSYYRRVLLFDAPSRLFLTLQHKIYYIVMSLGRFNLYANSYGFLVLKAKRDKWFWIETTGLLFFWYWFAYLYLGAMQGWATRVGALLISHIVTSPLHVQVSEGGVSLPMLKFLFKSY
jgi:delta8-fatty-acid desaturase